MKRIIFVGLHNKAGMKPLDSRTKSGKLIDRIITGLKGYEIVLKTNLFDVDYNPNRDKRDEMIFDWVERVELHYADTIVLLGATVHESFPDIPANIIKVAHPASKRSHKEMDEYVSKTIELLTK